MLAPGVKLGPYEIAGAIGRGGMGEVYRARDTRLNRDVAIKVSADRFSDRFEREARAVAALNHPNICTVFDVGPNYLVMELIEGETLAERIKQGPIPLDEALAIATQIADALDAAHTKGIIHRDLKPGNIKIKPGGAAGITVKVLDFGLAKFGAASGAPTGPANEDSPTLTMPLGGTPGSPTELGVILGTAPYMAPEQARGKVVDKRADIWAFGVVLYEMLVGQRPFGGEDLTETLASVVRDKPDLDRAPLEARKLLEACLQKDPAKRLRDIADSMRLVEGGPAGPQAGPQPGSSSVNRKLPWLTAAALGLIAAVTGFLYLRQPAPTEPHRQLALSFPAANAGTFHALSPDGQRLAYVYSAEGRGPLIYVRSLDSLEARPLESTAGARSIFWSPDSRSLGFFSEGKLKTVSATGGPAQPLCDAGLGSGGSWNADGVILLGTETSGPILRVNASGGPCTEVTKTPPTARHRFPHFVPGGKHFLYSQTSGDPALDGLFAASLDDPTPRQILRDRSGAIYAPPRSGDALGHLLFLRDSLLMAVSFDVATLQVQGDPVPIRSGVNATSSGTLAADVSAGNLLIYLSGNSRNWQVISVDRTGKETTRLDRPGYTNLYSSSPDGRKTAINRSLREIWLVDSAAGQGSRWAGSLFGPVWSPDGARLIYPKGNDLWMRDAIGEKEEPVVTSTYSKRPGDWSRDGKLLFYTEVNPTTGGDIWYARLDAQGKLQGTPEKFAATSAEENLPQISPDGRLVSYGGERGTVFVKAFPPDPNAPPAQLPSVGLEARWSEDGKALYFVSPAGPVAARKLGLLSIPVTAGPNGIAQFGKPTVLFERSMTLMVPNMNSFSFNVLPDDRGFLMLDSVPDATPSALHVITNWHKLLTAPAQ